jgi:hypothetical protein
MDLEFRPMELPETVRRSLRAAAQVMWIRSGARDLAHSQT